VTAYIPLFLQKVRALSSGFTLLLYASQSEPRDHETINKFVQTTPPCIYRMELRHTCTWSGDV